MPPRHTGTDWLGTTPAPPRLTSCVCITDGSDRAGADICFGLVGGRVLMLHGHQAREVAAAVERVLITADRASMPPHPEAPDRPRGAAVLSPVQVAARYPIGLKRLRRLCAKGEIPSLRLDRRILIRPDDVETWLASQAQRRAGWNDATPDGAGARRARS